MRPISCWSRPPRPRRNLSARSTASRPEASTRATTSTSWGTPGDDVIKCHVTDLNDGEKSVFVYAGAGNDDVFFGGVYPAQKDGPPDTIYLGPGNDKFNSIVDTRAANLGIVHGGLGDDNISLGREGYDFGAHGNDGEIYGNAGNDTIKLSP
ncbi:hypothetical protein [Amycolatopsis sp. lyj-108]|uniref:hypothetical protein n=1 Tax=Amycolatopsis sp. lyj-108 TaxID=2789286 RepID=UPI0039785ACD